MPLWIQRLEQDQHNTEDILLDSGAEGGNYVSATFAEQLGKTSKECEHRIILPDQTEYTINSCIYLDIKLKLYYKNNLLISKIIKNIKFYIFDKLCTDIIIGLPAIRQYQLTRVFDQYYNHIEASDDSMMDGQPELCETVRKELVANDSEYTTQAVNPPQTIGNDSNIYALASQLRRESCQCSHSQSMLTNYHQCRKTLKQKKSELIAARVCSITSRPDGYYKKSDFLSEEPDDDYAEDRLEAYPPLSTPDINSAEQTPVPWSSVEIDGPEIVQSKLEGLLATPKYHRIFTESATQNPATMNAMKFDVNDEEWFRNPVNRQPTRMQSAARQFAIDRFLKKAIADGIIKPSSAPAWSQLFLTPKKTGDFRICLDYRSLNKATKRLAWPMPRIDEMLHRIGQARPEYFAVLDLSQGFYQCPIAAESQKYTTFSTFKGNYMWTRLPMGPTNSPAHFQREMTTTVFAEEMYHIIEIYLDDLITWAKTEDELIERLTIIFDKLLKYNITLNPKKCRLGMSKVEYVGHTIDKNGLHFSTEKLNKVLDFPLPKTHEDMRSFIGLCTYFSRHVEHFTELTHSLRKTYAKYSKKTPIKWTDQLRQDYEALKQAVGNCPTLSFPQPEGEIVVETDASDFAIGAALYQIVMENGAEVKKPLAFLSKQLSGSEQRWSTIEKEAFAIYVALTKWEWLLRDITFTLYTDHKNLTFIERDTQGKVRRWKIAIQQFSFVVYWIPGDNNILADRLSRVRISEPQLNHVARLLALRPTEPYTYYRGDDGTFEGKPSFVDAYKSISQFHNSNVGHMGVEKTITRLENHGIDWPSRYRDVQIFVRRCPCCQLMRQIKVPITTNPYTVATYYPMDRLNVDTIGPLPEDKDGYKHILVVIDAFTRFVELYRTKDTTGESAAEALVQHVGRYGTPAEIMTDRGTQFRNDLISALQRQLQVEHSFGAPYSHEENSMVERANKEVNRHLRNIVFHDKIKSEWSLSLPIVQRILNSQVHHATKVSPAQLLFGNAIDLERRMFPAHKTTQTAGSTEPVTVRAYIDKMLAVQEEVLKIAQRNQQSTDQYNIQKRQRGPATEFPINSYVLYTDPTGWKHPGSDKLSMPHRGPFRVINRFTTAHSKAKGEQGQDIYVIENLVSHERREVHAQHLQPFEYDEEYVDPTTVAAAGQQEFMIDQIIAHYPNLPPHQFVKLKKSSMEFLVKYTGFATPELNSWDNLRTTEALHKYLYDKGMKQLIPPAYRINALHRLLAIQVDLTTKLIVK